MHLVKYLFIIFMLGLLSVCVKCQSSPDSTTQKLMRNVANRFAEARPINVEYNYNSDFNFAPKSKSSSLVNGKVTRFSSLRTNLNYTIAKNRKWIVSASFQYRMASISANYKPDEAPVYKLLENTHHYHATSANVTYLSKLFGKPAFYTGSFIVDGSDKGFERFKAMGVATLLLKANAQTKMAVGLSLFYDPGAQLPIFPFFTLEHKFKNGFTADIIFPQQMLVRKIVNKKGRFSAGMQMDRTNFYLYNNNSPGLRTSEFRGVDCNNGFIYEHLLFSNLVLTTKAGSRLSVMGRAFEKSMNSGSPFYDGSLKPGFYFNVGLSGNPFVKKK